VAVIARARIRCAESGHQWEDAPWFQIAASEKRGIRFIWQRRQSCERDGCERTRVDTVMPKTFQLLTRTYGGRLERIGRISREDMRREIIEGK
jgi:transposase